MKEEEEDNYRNDTSAFMVSRHNASKFLNETAIKNNNLPDNKKVLIPNKILDSMVLKYSEDEQYEEDQYKKNRGNSGLIQKS